jgi:hypothetical protein
MAEEEIELALSHLGLEAIQVGSDLLQKAIVGIDLQQL